MAALRRGVRNAARCTLPPVAIAGGGSQASSPGPGILGRATTAIPVFSIPRAAATGPVGANRLPFVDAVYPSARIRSERDSGKGIGAADVWSLASDLRSYRQERRFREKFRNTIETVAPLLSGSLLGTSASKSENSSRWARWSTDPAYRRGRSIFHRARPACNVPVHQRHHAALGL